jgi:hypothetical protein
MPRYCKGWTIGLDQGQMIDYSVFTSGAYRATAPNAAFPQEKPHFAALS